MPNPVTVSPQFTGGAATSAATQNVKFGNILVSNSGMFWVAVLGLFGLAYWAVKK